MKFILAAVLLFGTLPASAGNFSEDCDVMRETVTSLTVNLTSIDDEAMKSAQDLETRFGVKADMTAHNKAVRDLADSIDRLGAKINQSCK